MYYFYDQVLVSCWLHKTKYVNNFKYLLQNHQPFIFTNRWILLHQIKIIDPLFLASIFYRWLSESKIREYIKSSRVLGSAL